MTRRSEAIALEAFLARLYVDADCRARFSRAPLNEALGAGLSERDAHALCAIDHEGLRLAAHSFAHKRGRVPRRQGSRAFAWLSRLFRLRASL